MTSRLAVRALSRQRALSLAVIVTIALAVSVNTAIMSVVDGLLFRPLPYADSDRIVHLEIDPLLRDRRSAEGQAVLDRAATTNSLISRADAGFELLFDPTSEPVTQWNVRAARLSDSAFELLGIGPAHGRPLLEREVSPNETPILLGYQIWVQRFGGDLAVLGRLVDFPGLRPGRRLRVVGIMPEGFSFPNGANLWLPARPATTRVPPFAKLAPGTTIEAVRAELPGIRVTSLREHVRPRGAAALLFLLVGSTLLVLVAFIQVASLMVARALERIPELGIRLTLGSSRRQILGQFLVEALILVGAGSLLALLAAGPLTSLLVRLLPLQLTTGQSVGPDIRVLVWAIGISLAAVLVLTVVPISAVRKTSPLVMTRGEISAVGRSSIRAVLFVGQLAAVSAAGYAAVLSVRSFNEFSDANLGFDLTGVVAVRLSRGDGMVSGGAASTLSRQSDLAYRSLADLGVLGSVVSAAGTQSWPLQPVILRSEVFRSSADPENRAIQGKYMAVTPGFFRVLGLQLDEGVEPTSADLAGRGKPPGQEQLAAVNRSMARHLTQFGTPLGQLLGGTFRVVAVVPDAKFESVDRELEPMVFHYLPPPAAPSVLVARLKTGTSLESSGVTELLRGLWGRWATQPFDVSESIAESASDHRARALVISLVSFMTLPLAVVGILGHAAFVVRQNARSIGVRLAVGAAPRNIIQEFVGRTMVLATIATGLGLLAGISAAKYMESTLFGVRSFDPWAVLVVTLVMLPTVACASFFPALRASRMNPVFILKSA